MGAFTVTVFRDAEGYYEEKKSKFISNVFRVESEEEALSRIQEVRKKHYDARHHCYAYVIGELRDKMKCSDDGEPQKTAGVPILSVLNGQEVTNCLIVVTRYFGGTLLGTGGLVRAYTKAAQDGLAKAGVFEKRPAAKLSILVSYEDYNRIQRYLQEGTLKPSDTEFTDKVRIEIPVPLPDLPDFTGKITEFTQNRAIINEEGRVFFAEIDGKIQLFTA